MSVLHVESEHNSLIIISDIPEGKIFSGFRIKSRACESTQLLLLKAAFDSETFARRACATVWEESVKLSHLTLGNMQSPINYVALRSVLKHKFLADIDRRIKASQDVLHDESKRPK